MTKDQIIELYKRAKDSAGRGASEDKINAAFKKLIHEAYAKEEEHDEEVASKARTQAIVDHYMAQARREVSTSAPTSRKGEIESLYARNPKLAEAAGLVRFDVTKPTYSDSGNVLNFGEMTPVVAPRPGPTSRS